ncbi:DDB1- and CUL4-associated factor 13 isoform X1 [Copidosoma floridanum]|uniref:DDB1- and CUL4-associated factor 13 isoform X1 n=1 Tax=Copidosoma floridanum TaxID=29053 RepID=UPI0006C940D8|nr:DDB1- and CUL4-associated factor 13 isoform X1 [Copidosoma floridanum]XP_014208900.1 DDB1- and CUL4-associated factor 13 isoform X1 [Copidosoma floridanum]
MKVKVLSRNPSEYLRETTRDIHKVPRNYNPALHPFEAPREYTRALNAVKLDRTFAKPFIGNLEGHTDSVSCLSKHPSKLGTLLSGAFDGVVKVWNLTQRTCVRTILAHNGTVAGIAVTPDAEHFVTVGIDQTIKTWSTEKPDDDCEEEPTNTIIHGSVITGISHHRENPQFATCGHECNVWEYERNIPIKTYKWGNDTLNDVKFNQVQTNLLATCTSGNKVIIYDTRKTGPMRSVQMNLRPNKLCWNPMEAFTFTIAGEDYNLYTFDIRQMKSPVNVHFDHTEAVTDIDYSPTGREFVSGSYDRSIRIFEVNKGHSREIYHTKRMQRLTCVAWTLDNKYIINGSDEMNIRIWKAKASEKLGVLRPREKASLNYSQTLKEKFASHPQIRRIARHRQVPKHIYKAQDELRAQRQKIKLKESRRRAHSKPGAEPFVSERKRHVTRMEV